MPGITRPRPLIVAGLMLALLAAGCQSPGGSPTFGADPELMPVACTTDAQQHYPLYGLPATTAPAGAGKGQLALASVSHPVKRALTSISAWRDLRKGWATIGLRITSANAANLSVHLTEVFLPAGAQVWLCSANGKLRRGPLHANDIGDIISPVVTGDEALLEVIAPAASIRLDTVTLLEVYAGFR